jgi:TonB family protein
VKGLFAQEHMGANVSQTELSISSDTLGAQFPGGWDALTKWINANMVYPYACRFMGVEGRVVVGFTLTSDGRFVGGVTHESPDPRLEKEAWRLVGSMPNLIPAKEAGSGVFVDSYVCLGINFVLPDAEMRNNSSAGIVKLEKAKIPGGEQALQEWVYERLRNNENRLLIETGETDITLDATVETDGTVEINNVFCSPRASDGLRKYARLLFARMPHLIPARIDGQPVKDRIRCKLSLKVPGSENKIVHAEFPGGIEGLQKWVYYKIHSDKEYLLLKESGTDVTLDAVVGVDGRMVDYEVSYPSDAGDELKKSANLLLKEFPHWIPAKIDGMPVKDQIKCSLSFRLPGNEHKIVDASFPGGHGACVKWLQENFKYPVERVTDGQEGRVVICVAVMPDGTLINPIPEHFTPFDKDNPRFNFCFMDEIKRLIEIMPKWNPAQFDETPVETDFRVPITIRMPGHEYLPEDSVYNVARPDTANIVEERACFPGGDEACIQWLRENVKYPSACQEKGVQGRVIVSFVVNRDGSIEDAKVMRSPHQLLSDEALRVVSLMPKWTPAMVNGIPVRSRFSFPIIFWLG